MEQVRLSFYDEIRNNKIYSVLLIFFVFVILVALGYAISFAFDPSYFFFILVLSIVISILYIWIGYYNSASIAIASVGGIVANPREHKIFFDLVEGLTLASGLPMPKLYVMKNDQINAFASGRDPKHAVICITTGTLEKLNKQELEGVLSHELSHIANYDIRFMTLTAVLVGMIAIISEIFLRSMWNQSRSSNDDNKGNGIFLIIGIVLAILAPIIVQLVQLAISRKREFVADASAVKFTRTPTGLIGALSKIKENRDMKVSGAVAPLFLAKPNRVSNLFETHPPLEVRIEKLRKM
jgi:heat shock protein HtpX